MVTTFTDCPIRVRYAETDRMGVAHHSNHFIWFEAARSEYCRARGFSYRQMEEEDGCLLMVAAAQCRYKAPLFYEDEMIIRTRIKTLHRKLIVFHYEIFRQGSKDLIATGETSHLITDKQGKPTVVPESYLEKLRQDPSDSIAFISS